ncbi:hypothetical protein QCBJ_27235 [Pseudomonas sp. QC2]|nr:hypothetical protein QCBJ_27235 [Pseudomonas sp. QC2]
MCALCGSWLACDAGTSVFQLHRVDAIAGKPAPTQARATLLIGVVPVRAWASHQCDTARKSSTSRHRHASA